MPSIRYHIVSLCRPVYQAMISMWVIGKTKPKRVTFYFPGSVNPYQKLLYSRHARNEMVRWLPSFVAWVFPYIFRNIKFTYHQHWIYSTNSFKATMILWSVWLFRRSNSRVIWTLHNVIPHETDTPEKDAAFYTKLARIVDIIHLHYEQAITLVNEHYTIPTEKVRISPHGHYIDIITPYQEKYPEPELNQPVRFFAGGQIRGYKGLDELVLLFESLPTSFEVKLVISGKSVSAEIPDNHSGRIEQFISRESLPQNTFFKLVRGCHFCILPYRKSLTSGMMLYALSCGMPVIAPNYGHFAALLNKSNGILYDMDDENGLRNAIEEACNITAEDYTAMRKNAYETALQYPWDKTAELLFAA